MANELFTIGHSNHSMEQFLALLNAHGIGVVADVRSSPYSKYAPQYSKGALELALNEAHTQYLFLGQELGARRAEESCYVDGQAKYERITELPAFARGLERVLDTAARGRAALMCSEADPLTCHRMVLVCRALCEHDPTLRIHHILSDGTLESQEAAEERLVALHKLQIELFGELTTHEALIARAYGLQGEKIAYKRDDVEL